MEQQLSEIEFEVEGTDLIRIPDGIYQGQCIKYEPGLCFGKNKKLFLHFQITTEGEEFGKVIVMCFNVNYKKLPKGSKYFKTWVFANKGIRPARGDRLSSKVFMNKVFKFTARTVKPKFNTGQVKPEFLWYSVIDELIEIVAG